MTEGKKDIEIQKLLKEIKNVEKSSEFNISVIASKESIFKNPELFKGSLEFVKDTSEIFQDRFHKILREIEKEGRMPKLNDKVIDFLMNKKIDLPEFILISSDKAADCLRKFDLQNSVKEINKDSLLLVFKLPKQLDFFWRKSKHNLVNFDDRYPEEKKYLWKKDQYKRSMGVTEWGKVYYELMPTIWEQRDFYCDNRGKDIYFWRLNRSGEHKIGEFFYIWEVVKNPYILEESREESSKRE